MSTLPEQFSAARQSQAEAQLNFLRSLTSRTFESAEKIIALNINASRASVEKSSAAMRQLITAQDPRDLLSLTNRTQENFDSLLAYGRELFSIAASLQAGLIKPAAPVSAPAPVLTLAAPPAAGDVKPAASPKPVAKAKPSAKAAGKASAEPKPAAAPFPAASTRPLAPVPEAEDKKK